MQTYRSNPLLRLSYSLIAPVYDLVVAHALQSARTRSLKALPNLAAGNVLLSGVGTGLDLPILPELHHYTALDFNSAMLSRARPRATNLHVDWILGDSMALPFADNHFDHVVLHLITSVVPHPAQCLGEASRVLKPGGTIILLDKFLSPGQIAPLRRALNPLSRRLATRMDVVFEELLPTVPALTVLSDTPVLMGKWFRSIVLQKSTRRTAADS
jgi:ubiquinone/menaquinone biosynthesis C-methylase UbiE